MKLHIEVALVVFILTILFSITIADSVQGVKESVSETHSVTTELTDVTIDPTIDTEPVPTEPIVTVPTEPPVTVPTEPVKSDWEIAVECSSEYELGINMKNMFFVTGVSIDELNMLLEGTPLEGAGKYFKQLEDEYGVNAIVAVSVGRLESQLGDTEIARTYNNAFGFRGDNGWVHFKSLEDSVLYFGKLMQYERYLGKPLAEIGKIYCPNDNWCDKVSNIVDRHVKMIETFREEHNDSI